MQKVDLSIRTKGFTLSNPTGLLCSPFVGFDDDERRAVEEHRYLTGSIDEARQRKVARWNTVETGIRCTFSHDGFCRSIDRELTCHPVDQLALVTDFSPRPNVPP